MARRTSVSKKAEIGPKARVTGAAVVRGKAKVLDTARVSGHCEVSGRAVIQDRARIAGNAEVCDHAVVEGDAWVFQHALVKERARISGHACIFADAVVSGGATVAGLANVGPGARVKRSEHVVVLIPDEAERTAPKDPRKQDLAPVWTAYRTRKDGVRVLFGRTEVPLSKAPAKLLKSITWAKVQSS